LVEKNAGKHVLSLIDPWSFTALQIRMTFGQNESHGTGSIWSDKGRHFLVTNWHNFSGKNADTGRHLAIGNWEPNEVHVSFLQLTTGIGWQEHSFPLYDKDSNPLWFELPASDSDGACIDLAALEITLPDGCTARSPHLLIQQSLKPEIGAEVFIIGYPFRREVIGLPIWKRASIASELQFPFPAQSAKFYVDTATRKGMSGSLVLQKVTGRWSDKRGNTVDNGVVAYQLLGVYSGRIGANCSGDAQLGLVWPKSLVEALLDKAMAG
jgi:Trypsin-like peptidase domain